MRLHQPFADCKPDAAGGLRVVAARAGYAFTLRRTIQCANALRM